MHPELEQALYTIAARLGRDPNQLLAELLRNQAPPGGRAPELPPHHQGYPVEVLPPAPRVNLPQRYAGVPQPNSRADMEAFERYLEAESGPTGVFGDGGMSAGGVFGSAPVATAGHDPSSDLRSAQAALARLAPQLVAALSQPRYQQQAYPPPLPPQQQPVRMVTHTTSTVTYYEGPPQQQFPQPQPPPALPPWPWGRR